jgi:hypothetical protein
MRLAALLFCNREHFLRRIYEMNPLSRSAKTLTAMAAFCLSVVAVTILLGNGQVVDDLVRFGRGVMDTCLATATMNVNPQAMSPPCRGAPWCR